MGKLRISPAMRSAIHAGHLKAVSFDMLRLDVANGTLELLFEGAVVARTDVPNNLPGYTLRLGEACSLKAKK